MNSRISIVLLCLLLARAAFGQTNAVKIFELPQSFTADTNAEVVLNVSTNAGGTTRMKLDTLLSVISGFNAFPNSVLNAFSISNLGGAYAWFAGRSGSALTFNTLSNADSSISINSNGNTLQLAATNITTPKIQNGAVTYAKMQNVTSGALLGRSSAGAGVTEEITPSTGVALLGGLLSVVANSTTQRVEFAKQGT